MLCFCILQSRKFSSGLGMKVKGLRLMELKLCSQYLSHLSLFFYCT
uniref:Uncharacterized protein n=1 Tax=Arundo donax TaxID=35708 RepID=A0A0A9BI42_ARUDO